MNQRILIFQDGAKLKLPPEKWRSINVLSHTLIQLIREPGFDYEVVDPTVCADKLQSQLNPDNFSCVIDLSGLFGNALRETGIRTFDELRLSRLRKISSPLFDGVGFIINIGPEKTADMQRQIQQIRNEDSRPVLLLDDVGWSGRTMRQTVSLLGLTPDGTTIALLVGNRGTFGDKKTDIQKLEEEGFQIVVGEDVETPQDDGFHLADFTIGDESNFSTIVDIQMLREIAPTNREALDKIRSVLENQQVKLFPNAINSKTAKTMASEGRLIGFGGISSDSFFDINPTNWLMPSFAKRISANTLRRNCRDIIDVTKELQEMLKFEKEDREVQNESREIRGKEKL